MLQPNVTVSTQSPAHATVVTTMAQPFITTQQPVVSAPLGQPPTSVPAIIGQTATGQQVLVQQPPVSQQVILNTTAGPVPVIVSVPQSQPMGASSLLATPLSVPISTPATPPSLPVYRQQPPTQAFLDASQKLKDTGIFAPHPIVPGATMEEQKRLDAMHEQNLKKLPAVQLKTFSGREDFSVWVDHFNKIIGAKDGIDTIVKMTYLENSLRGKPKEDIVNFTYGLGKDCQFDMAMDMLKKMYGGELKRQNQAQQRFAQTQPLKNLEFNEVSRIYIAISNLVAFHKSQQGQYILDNAASADYRDARRKFGDFIKDYDLWVAQQKLPSTLTTLHDYITVLFEARSNSTTLDQYYDSDNDGMAHYGRSHQRKGFRNNGGPTKDSRKEANHRQSQGAHQKPKETNVSRSAKSSSKEERHCSHCGMDNHTIDYCFKFKKLEPRERFGFAKENRLRYCCLKDHPGRVQDCEQSTKLCSCGQGTHHSLLHDAFVKTEDKNQKPQKTGFKGGKKFQAKPSREKKKSSGTEQANHGHNGQAFIQVGQCLIHSGNRQLKANVLVDLGCDHTSIRTDVAQELNMPTIGEPIERKLSVMSGKKIVVPASQLVEFAISASKDTPRFKHHGIDYKTKYPIKAYTMPNAVGKCPVPDWSTVISDYEHLQGVDTPNPAKRPVIDLVLGCDYTGLAVALESRSGKPDEPAAHLLKIGWVIFGNTGLKNVPHFRSYKATVIHNEQEENLERLAQVFADYHDLKENGFESRQESVGSAKKEDVTKVKPDSSSGSCDSSELLKEDAALKEKIQNKKFTARQRKFDSEVAQAEYDKIQVKQLEKGYEATVPWKEEEPNLKNNRGPVLERQKKAFAESALKKKDVTIKDLQVVVDDHLEKKYIRKLSE